jgi:hypothetical protein
MTHTVAALLARNLLGVFGEPDARKRRAAIAEIWAQDGIFADAHGRHVGWQALDEAVEQLHAKFPGFVFSPIGPPQTFHEAGRQAWGHGPAGESPKITGEDVITVRDGRIASLYAFIDAPPTA